MSGFAKRYSFRSGKVHDESCKFYNSAPLAIAACCILFCLGIGLIIGFETDRGGGQVRPWQQVRLPESLLPIHYDVELRVDVTAFTVVGQVNVTLRCATPTRYVILHSAELDIVDGDAAPGIRGEGDVVTTLRVTSWFLYTENQYLVLELDSELTKGAVYTVSLNFRGTLRDGLVGFYRSSYVNKDGQTRYLATTHMQPMGARLAFPCFDEPAFKATFTVTLVHRAGYTALANMPLENNVTRNDGWIADRFQRSVRMPTYLLAFVVSDFTSVSTVSSSGLQTRVWARPEYISAGMGDYALDVADRILAYYEEYFDVPFPLPKSDHISIPDYSIGAMENWGLITYAENLLLYDARSPSASKKRGTARIVAHELAHMWFGNLVTMEWWDGTWLNEGFASYVEYLGYGYVEPDLNVMEQFAYSRTQGVMKDDSLTSSHPIFQPVIHPNETRAIFDSITYSKGASILRMLGNFLGESTFRKGLKAYLERNAYSNAVQDELWEELTLAARADGQTDLDVKTVMDTWTLQMGYPVVSLTRDYGRGTAQATQQYFLLDPTASTSAPSDFGYRWHIPLTFITRGNSFDQPEQVWMRPDQDTSSVNLQGAGSDDWVLTNIHRVGYYRVNYDQTNWQLLIDHLNSDLYEDIPPDNRGTLVDDAFNLGRAGQLDLSTALDLTRYLVRERHFIPWSMAKAAMDYVVTVFGSVRDIYDNWQAHMVQLIGPFYNEVGWTPQQSDYNNEAGQVLAISTACTYGQTGCVNNATALFRHHIPETFKSTIYCTAIGYGGSREWDFAWQRYLEAEPSEQSLLLSAMACSRDTVILSRYLERSTDAALVRRQSAPNVISYVGGSDVGKSLAWNFLVDNWDFYVENYDETQFTMASIVLSVTKQFSTQEDLDNLEQFLTDHPNQGTATRAFSQAVDSTRANLRFRQDNESKIRAWLERLG
ncbi:Endoplasmic reticulum aminopeptidase 1 [Branchiostoma belcheri]|nr:Endoplasmic reticulum aminopeptidase 1 [Branchiostoma belcheri]